MLSTVEHVVLNSYHPVYDLWCIDLNGVNSVASAVHRSRRAGAGVLTYFAGAGAGVCPPPVKL